MWEPGANGAEGITLKAPNSIPAGYSLTLPAQQPNGQLLLFPAPMWRVDTTVLIVAGVFLLPVALGKWALNREEGMILIAAYFFYLVVTAASGK